MKVKYETLPNAAQHIQAKVERKFRKIKGSRILEINVFCPAVGSLCN